MRINWETPVDELYHGDNIVYVDLDADEIVHFKYIKREKLPNGKYRYFYDQSELDKLKSSSDRANAWKTQASADVKDAKYAESRAKELAKKTKEQANNTSYKSTKQIDNDKHYAKQARKNLKTAADKRDKAEEIYKIAAKTAKKKLRKYNTKKVVSFPARTIAKGAVKVANLFSGYKKTSRKK